MHHFVMLLGIRYPAIVVQDHASHQHTEVGASWLLPGEFDKEKTNYFLGNISAGLVKPTFNQTKRVSQPGFDTYPHCRADAVDAVDFDYFENAWGFYFRPFADDKV